MIFYGNQGQMITLWRECEMPELVNIRYGLKVIRPEYAAKLTIIKPKWYKSLYYSAKEALINAFYVLMIWVCFYIFLVSLHYAI